jgi:hypothetical protein
MRETSADIDLSDAERNVLERVRARQGLATIEQAAEWLAKRRIRRAVRDVTGCGRALYVVERKKR